MAFFSPLGSDPLAGDAANLSPNTIYTPITVLNRDTKNYLSVMSDDGLTISGQAGVGALQAARSTTYKTTGVWQFEVVASVISNSIVLGCTDTTVDITNAFPNIGNSGTPGARFQYSAGGGSMAYGVSGGFSGGGITAATVGDYVGCVIDCDNQLIRWYVNGVETMYLAVSGRPCVLTEYYAFVGGITADTASINFGRTAFQYPIAGATPWAAVNSNRTELDPSKRQLNNAIITNKNLTVSGVAQNAPQWVLSSNKKLTGKHYFEVYVQQFNLGTAIALINSSYPYGTFTNAPGRNDANGITFGHDGYITYNNIGFGGPTHPSGGGGNSVSVLQVCLNANTGDVWFGKNNVFNGNPAAGTGGYPSAITEFFATVGPRGTNDISTINFGQTEFFYSPPSGFSAWDVTGGLIKYWTGSDWVSKQLKYWDGSAWVWKPLKFWNGSTWVLA